MKAKATSEGSCRSNPLIKVTIYKGIASTVSALIAWLSSRNDVK